MRNLLKRYITKFNELDDEGYSSRDERITNEEAFEFLADQIPLFECPDSTIEQTYYFRWWTFRKHIRKTPDGYVITEFLPTVPHSSKYNVICCPSSLHIREGRWLKNPLFIRDYLSFLLCDEEAGAHRYSFWPADSLSLFTDVHPDDDWSQTMLPHLVKHYEEWEKMGLRRGPGELFAQVDLFDGGEWTAGGREILGGEEFRMKVRSVRPNFNSYLYGDATALSALASKVGNVALSEKYHREASLLRELVQNRLWNSDKQFFTCLPPDYDEETHPIGVRELVGYIPWLFHLPESGRGYEKAWEQLMDTSGFYAPFGPTTCEQRHPYFRIEYEEGCHCQWNGPSWPFATSLTLSAMANVLHDYQQNHISREDYYTIMRNYAASHIFREIPPGDEASGITLHEVPWIDENLDPYTGNWLSRYRFKQEGGFHGRGKDYNHSTFCDLIISGLVGLRPDDDCENGFTLNSLLPEGEWDWFRLENVPFRGHNLCIIWDKIGQRYNQGQGLTVQVDGKVIVQSKVLSPVKGKLG